MQYEFKTLDGEHWWGGTSNDGKFAPYDRHTELTHEEFLATCFERVKRISEL